jgi:hypothetical protein
MRAPRGMHGARARTNRQTVCTRVGTNVSPVSYHVLVKACGWVGGQYQVRTSVYSTVVLQVPVPGTGGGVRACVTQQTVCYTQAVLRTYIP